MTIIRRRIINPQRYLYALHPGDKFYIAVPLEEEDYPHLQLYGLLPDSAARIPIPRRAATTLNANGKWKALRDLPKEKRSFEHDYHIVDWHGNDHYGTCWQSRWCYQRELIPPTELAFVIEDVLAVHDTIQLDAHIHKDRVTGDGDDGARHFLTRLQAHSAGFLGREHGGEVFAAFFEGGQILFVSHGIFAP